ncbi:cupin domain-containing protein [Streptomyces sp. NPDC093250]|uniref:cupin domain-containing protein n=1 Tax=Streptomyces sp. NPDC093250 TaxID=3366036 RepID=UPI003817EF9E
MARPETPVNIDEKLAKVTGLWSPKTVLEANGLEFKAVKVQGEFVWHNHPEGDELFIVVRGELTIDLEDRASAVVRSGEMFVVPRGVHHRPHAERECEIVIMDPPGVVNTGEVTSDLTADEEWI